MSKIYKNYFSPKSVAERYAKGRPHFHPFIINQIKEFLNIKDLLPMALDVGCGTGLSTVALKEIAHEIIALDISSEMMAFAPKSNNIKYLVASAENLPIKENTFDLITISQAVHWIDRDKFFEEAHRILKRDGWLIAFDNYYTGKMQENEEFYAWHQEKYLERFPRTPKNLTAFKTDSKNPNDFILVHEHWHENIIEFSSKELVDYLITQSNVIALVENGKQRIEDATEWLISEISQFFENEARNSFIFNAPIWYLQRQAE